MNVIALMSLIGLGLVALSVVFFIHQTNTESGSEQDALLPLEEEGVKCAVKSRSPGRAVRSASRPRSGEAAR